MSTKDSEIQLPTTFEPTSIKVCKPWTPAEKRAYGERLVAILRQGSPEEETNSETQEG